jgi:cell division protein FtsI (penicillin-binding protein 3)
MSKNKIIKSIHLKSIVSYLILVLFALAIVGRILYIQLKEGSKLRELGMKRTVEEKQIDALRGNIYSIDNSLLAVTIPKYEIRMDVVSNKSDRFFNANVDSLAFNLSKLFKDRSKWEYKKLLTTARKKRNYYLLIKKNVSYKQFIELKKFPILRMGRNKGGLIAIKSNMRELPYKYLAKRTIGIYNYEVGDYVVGLEGAFNETLKGTYGKRLMQKIEGGTWMPVDPANEIKPTNGNDLVTTIDINIQDVAENSLRQQLELHKADHGCAIVMEVKTGEIRAIANLGREKDGSYSEKFNYAIGEATDPGSTFKLASILVALEDGLVNLEDTVDTERGSVRFYNATIRDAHMIDDGILSVRRVIEASSNVGIAKIIWENYSNKPQKFIDGLYKIGLQNKLDIPIQGEAAPYIKNTQDKSWSGISLPWIAFGYELKITPLQLLTFYNAIANDGKMVKPLFVREIRNNSKIIQKFDPTLINENIASPKTIALLQSMMEGVVLRGTARNIKNNYYSIAGKTGTAQIAQNNKGFNKTNYKASFCGYFPAEDPAYSIIVSISNPRSGQYYGNIVAAPVFKNISDRIYASQIELSINNDNTPTAASPALYYRVSKSDETAFLFDKMASKAEIDIGSEYVVGLPKGDSVHFAPRRISSSRVPKLTGMTAKDAVYLLEEMGLKVTLIGSGFVMEQSITAGTEVHKGGKIVLKLSNS